MLREDPNLPFLDMAWSRHKMTEFFNRKVLPAFWPNQQVREVARDDMTYTPGRKCVILYSLEFADEPRHPSRWAVATFTKDDRMEAVYARHYHGDGQPLSELAPAPAVFLPDYRCLVEFFPADWKLPSLARATQPKEIAPVLHQLGPNGRSSSRRAMVKVLRYRPHYRCVLSYRLDSPAGKAPKEVVGKVYPQGAEAEQVWHALNALHTQGTAPEVIIPEPLAMLSEWNTVLMERAPGTSMKWVLEEATSLSQARETVRLAAAALASFHSLCFESGEVRSLATELQRLRKRTARLYLVAPQLAEGVEAVLNRLEPLALACTFGAPSFIHGDYKPGQLLLNGRRVAVVDFDRACLGDPAMDVGNFMAQLHKEALSTGQDHLRQLAPFFLAEYRARSPRNGLDERARLFQVLALARMAVRKFQESPHSYVRKGPCSPQVLLREATECLARL